MTETGTRIAELPALDEDARDDACTRGPDSAWAALLALFDHYQREQGLTYEALGKRIMRSRSHVQRWLSAPFNMSLKSLGLLAEGLDADLIIEVRPRRTAVSCANYIHPRERAKERHQWAVMTTAGSSNSHLAGSSSTAAGSSTSILRVKPLVETVDG